MRIAEDIADDLAAHGIDVEVPTLSFIVIFDAEDWMLDIAHDTLDRYIRKGQIENYYLEPANTGGLMYEQSDMGISIDI
jgi:hypothetical protein